ncbi:MAG TPA: DUF4296 domain-containing protein [Bacteroidales bacterium]|nr:DUF4296 domain-containing protein [Bacteroidales bacterium]
MKFSIYIASRYLLAKKSRNAINVISAVSVAGVTVGTMALIIVLSVFNGLEDLINRIFTVFDPDLRITAAEGKVFTPDSSKLLNLSKVPGIEAYSFTLEENSLLKYGDRQYIASLRGVDDNYSKVTGIDSIIVEGEYRLQSVGGRPEAVVGAGVASYLGINVNFITPLHVYVPKRTGSVNLNPENAFIEKYLFPSGIYQIEHEFDSKYYFVPLDFAREILEYETEISSIDIRVNKQVGIGPVQKAVKEIFGDAFDIKNRYEQKEIFYKVMRSERLAIFIILTLILIIASFNIIGSLTMLIIEKEKDIIILRSLGADDLLIKRIFLMEGWLISIIGTVAGLILGFIICWTQQRYGLIKLQSETLIVNAYPVVLKLKDFIAVPATVLTIGFFAAWYPVRYLSKKYLKEKIQASNLSFRSIIIFIIAITSVLSVSCSKSEENKIKKSEIIPQKEFVNLLTDLYISDGLLSIPLIKEIYQMKDSTLNYIDVIRSHGYTKEKVDLTFKYYFMNNPKKLEKIYDQVIARLSELQSRLESEVSVTPTFNLWNMRPSYSVPSDGVHNKLWFSIPVKDTGTYYFMFDAQVYPDDQSTNLRTKIFFWKPDSTKQGVINYWSPSYYIRDGEKHSYTIKNTLTDSTFTHINGWLLEHDSQPGRWIKHVKITNIRVFKGGVE